MSSTTTPADHRPAGVSLVAGTDTPGDGETFTAVAPGASQALAPTYRSITAAQLETAVDAACQARRAPIDLPAIAVALDAVADAFEDAVDTVVSVADAETALGETRLRGEHARTVGQLRMMAEEARSGSRRDVVVDPAGDGPAAPALHRTTMPLGVVGVFAASNFPLAFGVAGTDTAAALGAGCPVIAKAHPAQPATAELCGRLVSAGIATAGLHPGFFSVVHEAGTSIGEALTLHDGVDAVAFTGSQRGGRALYDLAARRPRPIPVYAEMGSLNPLIVSAGAAAAGPSGLAEGIVGSYLLGEGQFCTKPGLVVLPDDAAGRQVLDGLAAAVAERAAAHPLLHEGITHGFTSGLSEAAALEGVVAVSGPQPSDGGGCPVALLQATPDALMAHEQLRTEIFGPVAVVVLATDAQTRDIAELLEPALTASLHFADDEAEWARSMADLLARKVGRVIANGYPTGVRVSPAQHHGGPYPATTSPLHTSVGLAAIDRFRRPVAFQSFAADVLPAWAASGLPGA